MAFIVLYDACVLYPAPLRDLLIRVAKTGVVRARWTDAILDECFRNILEQRPDLKPEALKRTRELMTQAVPDCLVTGFETLIDSLTLPDRDDRHVLAAAIRVGAQAIVTFMDLDRDGDSGERSDDRTASNRPPSCAVHHECGPRTVGRRESKWSRDDKTELCDRG